LPSPFRLALQISSSVSRLQFPSAAHEASPRPYAARLDPTAWPDFNHDTYRSHVRDSQTARSVFRTFPSRPIDPGSRDRSKEISQGRPSFPEGSRVHSHRVPILSHSFGSPRHRSPLRSISRSEAVTSLSNATSSSHRLSRPLQRVSSFISHVPFTDPPPLRSLVPFPSAPRTPRGFARTALGDHHHRAPLSPPFARPRPNSHAPPPLAHPPSIETRVRY